MGLVISGFEIIGAYTLSIMLYSVAVACMLGVDEIVLTIPKSEQTLMSDMVSGFDICKKSASIDMPLIRCCPCCWPCRSRTF